jgi:MFS family permease
MHTSRYLRSPWWLVAGSALALSVSCGTLLLFTFGALLKPVTTEMGWSRQVMSLAFGMATVSCALGMPLAGRLVDKLGPRTVALWGVALFAACFAAIALTSVSPAVFVALYGLAGFVGAAHTPIPYSRAIATRIDTHLGIALGLAMAGIGIGQALLPHVMQPVIASIGWRGTYLALGAAIFGIAFPAVLLFVNGAGTEGRQARAMQQTAAPVAGATVWQALTSKRFWAIATAVFLSGCALVGTVAHFTALLTDRNIDPRFAALLLSCVGLSALVGRLVCGQLMDHFHAPYVGAISFLLPVVGLALLLSDADAPMLIISAIALGQALGAEADMVGYLVRRYFGMRCFGELSGYMLAIFALGSSVGPLAMGYCYDTSGNYDIALMVFMIAFVIASASISRIGPYAFPAVKPPDTGRPVAS